MVVIEKLLLVPALLAVGMDLWKEESLSLLPSEIIYSLYVCLHYLPVTPAGRTTGARPNLVHVGIIGTRTDVATYNSTSTKSDLNPVYFISAPIFSEATNQFYLQ